MSTRQRGNKDKFLLEFSINKLLTKHNLQFAIRVNTIKKGNEQTQAHLSRELTDEAKQQSKVKPLITDEIHKRNRKQIKRNKTTHYRNFK